MPTLIRRFRGAVPLISFAAVYGLLLAFVVLS